MTTTQSTNTLGWGLAALRVVVGIVFLVHGAQKLFVYGFSGVAGFLGQVGIPVPMVSAVLVTAAEFLGGLALVLGVFTRWAALALAASLLAANVALALTGPGAASLDAVLATRRNA